MVLNALLYVIELDWLFNDNHMEDLFIYLLCFTEFSTKIHWNTRLAASDVFHMFTQSIKFF